eukprot:SAG22_NODE_125_length_18883_cov_12.351629_13_plen_77_part_00
MISDDIIWFPPSFVRSSDTYAAEPAYAGSRVSWPRSREGNFSRAHANAVTNGPLKLQCIWQCPCYCHHYHWSYDKI